METNDRATGSAHWTAAARAKESAREDRLFNDPFAGALAGAVGNRALEASERASGGDNPYLPVRTRWFDDLIGTHTTSVSQVVLLGAGFDTRAMRMPLPEALLWFELDTRAIFSTKEPILAALGARASCHRSVVAADLHADWTGRLLAAGFDPARSTLWIAEGLLFYLDEAAVHRLLSEAFRLSGQGSLFGADLFGTGLLRRRDWGSRPPFCSDDPTALFEGAGWSSVAVAEPWRDPTLAVRLRQPQQAVAPALDWSDRSWFVLAGRVRLDPAHSLADVDGADENDCQRGAACRSPASPATR